jgi:hypothetical protein
VVLIAGRVAGGGECQLTADAPLDVDRWAARTLPTLEAHLKQAESVAERVDKAESDKPAGRSGSSISGATPVAPLIRA